MYLALERYSRPSTIEECLRLYDQPGGKSALLAGGTELNAGDNEELTHVVDIQALPLDSIAVDGETLRIGACVTLGRLRRESRLQGEELAALREAAAGFANLPIQNRATLGGRIASDRSDQDIPPALLALGARLQLARMRDGKVEQSVVDYPTGPGRAVLHGALVTEVVLPLGNKVSALRRFGRTAVDVPLASCAAALRGGAVYLAANVQGIDAASLARLDATEKLATDWVDQRPGDWRDVARASLLGELASYEDGWATGSYRRDLGATLMVRAMAALFGEEESC